MSGAPVVSAAFDRPSYAQGDTATLTITVAADTRPQTTQRTAVIRGHDEEGNNVTVTVVTDVVVQVPDSFTVDSVVWEDTGAAFTVNGLQAVGTA
jgi:hypothetical protein